MSARAPRLLRGLGRRHVRQLLIALFVVVALISLLLSTTRMRRSFDVYTYVSEHEDQLNRAVPELLSRLREGPVIPDDSLDLGPVESIELQTQEDGSLEIRFSYPPSSFPGSARYGFYYSSLDRPARFDFMPPEAELEELHASRTWEYRSPDDGRSYLTRRVHKHWYVYYVEETGATTTP